MTATVAGAGYSLPPTVVDNEHFGQLGLTDRWIVSRTGIHSRRRLGAGESLTDLALAASRQALADAGIDAGQLDSVVVATITADRASPSLATELAARIGAAGPGAIDVNGACTGFLYALDYAVSKIEAGRADHVLVCGAEATSRIVNISDPLTAPLFGDGAGAVVVTREPRSCGCRIGIHLASDGAFSEILTVSGAERILRMDGIEVYQKAIETMTAAITTVVAERGIDLPEVDLVIPHQANARIVRQVAEQLDLAPHQAFLSLGTTGNTSSASIPIALAMAQHDGRLTPGARVVLAAFGAGTTWGAALLDWKGCRHS